MTDLRKPITRRTDSTIRDGSKPRRMVVTLYPCDIIGIRPEKTRREETTTLAAVWQMAVKLRVRTEQAERRAKRRRKCAHTWFRKYTSTYSCE